MTVRSVQAIDYAALAPPLIVAAAACLALVIDLIAPRRRALLPAVSAAGLVGAAVAVGLLASGPARATFCAPVGCSYRVDGFTLFFQALGALAGLVVVLLAAPQVERERLPAGEFSFLLLASVTGMLVLSASRDLLLLLLSLELVSLPIFVLVGLRRRDPRSSQAALTFFLVSVVATGVTAYGMSLLYGVTGSLQLDRIAAALAAAPHRPLPAAAIVLVVAGFGFKVSAVPFHFWAPDTYQGAPVPVAAFLAVASKAAGFAGLILLLLALRAYADVWGPLIAVSAALTMTVGNLAALRQRHVVRLLAWSSVAQAGYLLVPLGVAATARGRTDLGAAIAATTTYLGAYAAINLGAFGCAVAVAQHRPRSGFTDYRGLYRDAPALALVFALFLTALAGLPPGILGLIAKVVVFRSAVAGHLGWLAVVMAVNTVIGLAYYARLAVALFDTSVTRPRRDLPLSWSTAVAVGATAVVVLALGFWPQLLLHVVPTG